MQADNGIAYQYVLCNVQCTSTGLLDVIRNGAPPLYALAQVASISRSKGSAYNCHVASNLDAAHAAAIAMVHEQSLGPRERVVLCKIKQRSMSIGAPVVSTQAVPPAGLVGVSQGESHSYAYTVHRHAKTGDTFQLAQAGGGDADWMPRLTVVGQNGPYFARTLEDARAVATRTEAGDKSYAAVISRIESSTSISAPRVTLESVCVDGLAADNSRRYSYLVLRCKVLPDGRLDVHTRALDASVQALAYPYAGGLDSGRNMTFVRDYASVQLAAEQEQQRVPLARAQQLLVCKIKYVSRMSPPDASTTPACSVLHTDSKSFCYAVHRPDTSACGTPATSGSTATQWSVLHGAGMYMADTAAEATFIATQLLTATRTPWLVSRVSCVVQQHQQQQQQQRERPSIEFVSV